MTQALPKMTRRGFCLCCIASATFSAGGGWMSPRQAYAEARNIVDVIREDAATARINVHKLRGGVSVLEGSGGNVAVLTGPDGKLLVDAGITASKPRMMEALASLSSDPIRHLINTHWHFDHADGNEWVHGEGATILAHEIPKNIFRRCSGSKTGISISRRWLQGQCRPKRSLKTRHCRSTAPPCR